MNFNGNKSNNSISVLGANIIFLIGIIFLVFTDFAATYVDMEFGDDLFYYIAVFTEILFILIPPVILIITLKGNVKDILRLRPISFINVLIIIGIIIFAIPVIGFINFIVTFFISLVGTPLPNPTPKIEDFESLVLGLIIIAGVAGICEEVMFRGIVIRGYERFGAKTAIIVSSLLFALMHRNIQTLIGIFFIGLIIGYIVYLTDSIYAGIIAHITNNATAVIMTFAIAKLYEFLDFTPEDIPMNEITQVFNMSTFIFWGIFIALSYIVLWRLLKLLAQRTEKTERSIRFQQEEKHAKIQFSDYIPAIIGLGIISIMFAQQIYYIFSL